MKSALIITSRVLVIRCRSIRIWKETVEVDERNLKLIARHFGFQQLEKTHHDFGEAIYDSVD